MSSEMLNLRAHAGLGPRRLLSDGHLPCRLIPAAVIVRSCRPPSRPTPPVAADLRVGRGGALTLATGYHIRSGRPTLNSQFSILNSQFRLRRTAFTLAELVIVVLILGILATLVTTAASGIITSSRCRATMTTMTVIEHAISQFAENRPLSGGWYERKYDRFPPDGYTYGDPTGYPGPEEPDIATGQPWDWDDPPITDLNGNEIFDGAHLNKDIAGALVIEPENYDNMNIEGLYLYLSHLSPRSRTALEKLPAGQVVNQDADVLVLDTDGTPGLSAGDKRIDLFEIVDSWGRPFRYAIRPVWIGGFRWELRSAGPDGYFAPMWTPEGDTDDVVLTGP